MTVRKMMRMRREMEMEKEKEEGTEERSGREEYSYYLLYLLDGIRIIVRWNPVVHGSDL